MVTQTHIYSNDYSTYVCRYVGMRYFECGGVGETVILVSLTETVHTVACGDVWESMDVSIKMMEILYKTCTKLKPIQLQSRNAEV